MEDTLNASICPTCGHDRPDRFCPRCGEERVDPDAYTVRRFLHTAAVEESPIHGRTVRTLLTLFRRPGQLTHDYLIGKRLPYVSPFRLYLLMSVVFFLIAPHTGLFRYRLSGYETLPLIGDTPRQMVSAELARTGESFESYETRFNREIERQKKWLMFFLVPLFAAGMLLLFRRRHYGEHLVFSTHYFAMLLLYLGVFLQVFFKIFFTLLRQVAKVAPAAATAVANTIETELFFTIVIFVPVFFYLKTALRRAYELSARHSVFGALALVVWQWLLIIYFYRWPMFFTTFYSLKLFD